MKCDKCGKEIDKKDSFIAAREVPVMGFSRITQVVWTRYKTFCTKGCLMAYLRIGGEL